MTYTAIRLSNVYKSFGRDEARTQVLTDVNLEVEQGLTLITGPSGCGKTTLISIVGGMLNPDAGEVELLGTAIHTLSDEDKTEFRRHHIGFIFQQFNLVPTLTIQQNVMIPLLINHEPKRQAEEKVMNMLKAVGLAHRAEYYPRQISGGQQQRVAIARALVREPKLIICDEPTSALDSHTGNEVMQMLKSISQRPNQYVLIVTHDSRTYKFGDAIVEMEDGRVRNVKRST